MVSSQLQIYDQNGIEHPNCDANALGLIFKTVRCSKSKLPQHLTVSLSAALKVSDTATTYVATTVPLAALVGVPPLFRFMEHKPTGQQPQGSGLFVRWEEAEQGPHKKIQDLKSFRFIRPIWLRREGLLQEPLFEK